MMNQKDTMSLLGGLTAVVGFAGTFIFYIGFGLSGLGLRATSQVKRFLGQQLFPPCKLLVPAILFAGLFLCIWSLRKAQRPSPMTKIQIAGVIISAMGMAHLIPLWLVAGVCANFL